MNARAICGARSDAAVTRVCVPGVADWVDCFASTEADDAPSSCCCPDTCVPHAINVAESIKAAVERPHKRTELPDVFDEIIVNPFPSYARVFRGGLANDRPSANEHVLLRRAPSMMVRPYGIVNVVSNEFTKASWRSFTGPWTHGVSTDDDRSGITRIKSAKRGVSPPSHMTPSLALENHLIVPQP